MWQSYLPEVDMVLAAVNWPGLEEQREKDQPEFNRLKSPSKRAQFE